MQSKRAQNLTPKTLRYYTQTVGRFLNAVNPDTASPEIINDYLMQFSNGGGRHAHWRALRAFFNWREDIFNLQNPMIKMKAPKVDKLIMPTLRLPEIKRLIDEADTVRDQALIALLTESGMRLSKIANVKSTDIDWQNRNIRVIGKGRKERNVPFGQ